MAATSEAIRVSDILLAVSSLTTLGGLAAVITLAIMLARRGDQLIDRADKQHAAQADADHYHADRDLAVVHAAEQSARADAATAQLVATQAALAAAQKELAQHVHDQVLLAPVADAVAVVDGLLAQPLDVHAGSGATSAGGAGQHPATAVLVAEPARAGVAQRPPGTGE